MAEETREQETTSNQQQARSEGERNAPGQNALEVTMQAPQQQQRGRRIEIQDGPSSGGAQEDQQAMDSAPNQAQAAGGAGS